MAFFWRMTCRSSSDEGKLRGSRSSQGTAMTKGLYFPFLRPTSRKRSIFGTSVVSLLTERLQDRAGAAQLLIRILPTQCNGCRDGQAAYAVPPGYHNGFAVRHGHGKCVYPRIQTHCFSLG